MKYPWQIQPEIPFLVNEPIQLSIKQGVGRGWQDIFTVHRLKSLWSIETKNMRLTETNLAESIYATVDLTYATSGQGVQQLSGPISSWTNATNWLDGDSTVDS